MVVSQRWLWRCMFELVGEGAREEGECLSVGGGCVMVAVHRCLGSR